MTPNLKRLHGEFGSVARPVGTTLFVSKATIDAAGITIPTGSQVVDANGSLGDAAGAAYDVAEVIGDITAPTGYVLRRAVPTGGGEVNYQAISFSGSSGATGRGTYVFGTTPENLFAEGDRQSPTGEKRVPLFYGDAFVPVGGVLEFADASFFPGRAGTIKTLRVDAIGPFTFSDPGNPGSVLLASTDPHAVPLVVDLLKNGVVVGTATWESGDLGAKELVTEDVSFAATDGLCLRLHSEVETDPDATDVGSLWGYVVGIEWTA